MEEDVARSRDLYLNLNEVSLDEISVQDFEVRPVLFVYKFMKTKKNENIDKNIKTRFSL